MAEATFGFCSTHATASWASDSPASSASGRSRCTAVSTSSRSSRCTNREPVGSVAREPAGGGWPGAYLPVSTPCAIGDHTICEMPSFSHSGTTSSSMTRHSIEYCGCDDTIRSNPIASAICSASSICDARHSDTPT